MIRRFLSAVALGAALVAPLASHASMFGHAGETPSSTAAPVKSKMVKLTLKNKSVEAMTVYLNGQSMTLAPNGGTQEIKVAEGSDVLAADGSTVRLHVTSDLGGNTVSFR